MSQIIGFKTDRADLDTLLTHLNHCDRSFVPPLRDRVDICAYAKKILVHSIRFEAWHDLALIGLVAAYCNDEEKQRAYITNVSVLPKWQGKGIATQLLVYCLDYLAIRKVEILELEVDRRNAAAVALYRKIGFNPTASKGLSITMTWARADVGNR